jgi:hypothetical protein
MNYSLDQVAERLGIGHFLRESSEI